MLEEDRLLISNQVFQTTLRKPASAAAPAQFSAHGRGIPRKIAGPEYRTRKRLQIPTLVFFISLVIPSIVFLGPLRMSAYRLVLATMLVPCFWIWVGGKVGRIRLADIIVLSFAAWGAVSLVLVHGLDSAIQPAGILFIETAGAYFLSRCYIRSAEDFHRMVQVLFWIVTALLPFAFIEAVTGRNVAMSFFAFLPTPPDVYMELRWNLRRVQAVLEHPILFGVFCGSIFAMVHMVLGYDGPLFQRSARTAIVGAAAFLSLSAGPLTAIAAQGMLLLWNSVLSSVRHRWKLLWLAVVGAYMFVATVSNQSVPAFYVTHFSFDRHTAYYRLLIWHYGSGSVLHHPLFGTGFGEWDRPIWMPPSIDMFWLANAVFYGLPGGVLMIALFFAIYVPVGFRSGLERKVNDYKTAYLITLTGFFLVGWTVHFWNASYVLFIFLLGSGVWFLDASNGENGEVEAEKLGPKVLGLRGI